MKEASALRSKCALAATRIVNGAVERHTGDLHSVPMGLTMSEALFIATNINKLYNNSPLHLRVSGEKVDPFR